MNKYEVAKKLKRTHDFIRKKLRELEKEGKIKSEKREKLKIYYIS